MVREVAAAGMMLLLLSCKKSPEQSGAATGLHTDTSVEVPSSVAVPPPVEKPGDVVPGPRKPASVKSRILQSALVNQRFDPQKWLADDRSFPPPGPPGKISRYDPIIKKMARRYGFDWRLVSAQIYAESRFDSTARSHCGALGLMQMMPKTAQSLGTDPLRLACPESNIAAGCLYDRTMVSLWKKNVEHHEEQLAFALASYNAGRGRVLKSFSTGDSLTKWQSVHPLLPEETQDYVHRIALKYDFYSRHALP